MEVARTCRRLPPERARREKVNTHVTVAERALLEALSVARGKSVSDLVRDALHVAYGHATSGGSP